MDIPADDREINCIVDPIGNTGKSKFVKYMVYHHSVTFLPWGRTGDLLNYVSKHITSNVFMFDLSRSKPQDWARDDICAAIEQIKNGMIVNLKYETNGVIFSPPHVWIFSNQVPNLSAMSRDRWKLYEISPTRELLPISSRRLAELNNITTRASSPPQRTFSSRSDMFRDHTSPGTQSPFPLF